jgi:thiaminase (transcriptional activator TenA)
MMIEMTFTDTLYEKAKPIWDKQLEHPFVQGIADGSLDEDKFKNWVRQDYLYLIEFSRIFAWAAAKSERLESMSWYAFGLHLTLNTEMQLHREYAQRFNISAQELERETMWPTNRAYTDFLVRTAADGDMADLVAALLPCAWGYMYIGTEMAKSNPPKDRRYADWITQYSSKEFADAADWLKGEMNRLAEGATGEKKNRLIELFILSSKYEYLFWEMCWHGEEWSV